RDLERAREPRSALAGDYGQRAFMSAHLAPEEHDLEVLARASGRGALRVDLSPDEAPPSRAARDGARGDVDEAHAHRGSRRRAGSVAREEEPRARGDERPAEEGGDARGRLRERELQPR